MNDKSIICGEKEICKYLDITPKQLDALRREGLPVVHLAGRIWIHTVLVSDWFREQISKSPR